MKVFLQRVLSASVDVEGQRIAEIGRGLLLLCGIGTEDDESKLAPMAKKLVEKTIKRLQDIDSPSLSTFFPPPHPLA